MKRNDMTQKEHDIQTDKCFKIENLKSQNVKKLKSASFSKNRFM